MWVKEKEEKRQSSSNTFPLLRLKRIFKHDQNEYKHCPLVLLEDVAQQQNLLGGRAMNLIATLLPQHYSYRDPKKENSCSATLPF